MHRQQIGIGRRRLRLIRNLAALLALSAAVPALGAERGFTVTGFDRIRVEGPYRVTVATGTAPAARATGAQRALDSVSIRVDGRTLSIRRDSSWGGYPGESDGPVTIAIATPALTGATLNGGGSLTIDRMRGAQITLFAAGSGEIAIGRVETDMLNAAVAGSGGIRIAGTAATARIVVRGSGDVAAEGLSASDAEVTSDGAGTVTLAARRSAKVTATGTGTVTVTGDPACTVHATGSGTVSCGR